MTTPKRPSRTRTVSGGAGGRRGQRRRGGELDSLAYLNQVPIKPGEEGKQGVVLHAPGKTFDSYTLVNATFRSRKRYRGVVVHEAQLWSIDGKMLHKWSADPYQRKSGWAIARLDDKGYLHYVIANLGYVKLDWKSNVVWQVDGLFHHDFNFDLDGWLGRRSGTASPGEDAQRHGDAHRRPRRDVRDRGRQDHEDVVALRHVQGHRPLQNHPVPQEVEERAPPRRSHGTVPRHRHLPRQLGPGPAQGHRGARAAGRPAHVVPRPGHRVHDLPGDGRAHLEVGPRRADDAARSHPHPRRQDRHFRQPVEEQAVPRRRRGPEDQRDHPRLRRRR